MCDAETQTCLTKADINQLEDQEKNHEAVSEDSSGTLLWICLWKNDQKMMQMSGTTLQKPSCKVCLVGCGSIHIFIFFFLKTA